MKKYLRLYLCDIIGSLVVDVALDKDPRSVSYLYNRVDNEGISFLTKVLPKFSKLVLRAIEAGGFTREVRRSETSFTYSGALPTFCRVLLLKIFRADGTVHFAPSHKALKRILHLCNYFYKLEFDSSAEHERSTEAYALIESGIKRNCFDSTWTRGLRKTFYTIFGRTSLAKSTVNAVLDSHRPRFTSGAFYGSEGLPVPYWRYKNLPDRDIGTCRQDHRGLAGYFRPYPGCTQRIRAISEGKTSKLMFVPKDSRGPRTISKEPLHLVRTQMAFFDWSTKLMHRHSRGHINFRDQTINQALAKEGSKRDSGISTIDLKEASDRVDMRLCLAIFRFCPAIRWFLINARSTHCELPNGRTLELRKLAGMGSGLTFPLLALVSYLTAVHAIASQTYLTIDEAMSCVYVYGDDIVITNGYGRLVSLAFEKSGLKVNESKSYHSGLFRESCGGDFLNGKDVSTVKLRLKNTKPKFVNGKFITTGDWDFSMLSIERHCRELVSKGFYSLALYYYKILTKHLGHLPAVGMESSVLGNVLTEAHGGNVRGFVPVSSKKHTPEHCPYKHLSRTMRERAYDPFGFEDALLPYGVQPEPRKVKLKRRVTTLLDRLG